MTSDSFVFVGGRIATLVRGRPWADAVVVQGDRIAYVGDEAGAREHAPVGAEVVDLGGGVLLPGFVDSHDHLTSLAGVLNAGVNLNGIAEPQELLDAIDAYAKANPDLAVIRGKGFLPTTFPGMTATREMQLDFDICYENGNREADGTTYLTMPQLLVDHVHPERWTEVLRSAIEAGASKVDCNDSLQVSLAFSLRIPGGTEIGEGQTLITLPWLLATYIRRDAWGELLTKVIEDQLLLPR